MRVFVIAVMMAFLCVPCALAQEWGTVDLRLTGPTTPLAVGEVAEIALSAVSHVEEPNCPFCIAEVVLSWDATKLRLISGAPCGAGWFDGWLCVPTNGQYGWLFSGFPDDSGLDGINNTFDDGNADYQAWANFPPTPWPQATLEGLPIATFRFEALAPTSGANISIIPAAGEYTVSAVYDEEYGGWNIVGELGSATVAIGAWHVGDLNCDGVVSFADINPFVQHLSNFAAWHDTYPTCPPENGDINGDGTYGQVSFGDISPFMALLSGGG